MTLRVLDLFSGIGGFSLGLERAGMKTVAFCEIEPYPRAVLRKHWPEVPIYHDVRELTGEKLRADGISVDVIAGGFPCQDISNGNAVWGDCLGLAGERSGLWREYIRLIREMRPAFTLIENVSALLGRGMERILCDLAALGYDAEWNCFGADRIGAPHERDRLWIVAYTDGARVPGLVEGVNSCTAGPWGQGSAASVFAADPFLPGDRWPQPLIRRMDDGVPARVDRIKSLGNSVVPQIPEIIGRAILQAHSEMKLAA